MKTNLTDHDQAGMTPLHLAASEGAIHAVRTLLEKGADQNALNNHSQLPIQSALFVPGRHDDCITKKEEVFKLLWSKDPKSVMHRDSDGNSVFHQMAIYGFTRLLSEVLKVNPEGAFLVNKHSHYPIHTAILNQQFEIAERLLSIQNVSMLKDSSNRVALHYAARYGNSAMVQLCCNYTSDKMIEDGEGKTPLMLAEEAGNNAAVEILNQCTYSP